MKKLLFSFLLTFAGAILLFAQSQTYTFSPVFIGSGPPLAPSIPVPCPGVSIYFDNSSGQQYYCNKGTWTLAGQGSSTSMSVNPSSIAFGTVQTLTSSPPQSVTINNTGTTALTPAVTLSNAADFSSSNLTLCNEPLQAGATCVLSIQCSPGSTGAKSGTVNVVSSAGSGSTALSCTGTSSASFTLSINGSGNGTVTSDDGNLSCTLTNGVPSGSCQFSYASGSVVALTATASPGYSFSTFSGGGCSTSPCNVTVSANTTVSAAFVQTPNTVQLNVVPTGQGGGTITSSPSGISCTITAGVASGNCSAAFNSGTSITLTESPDGSSSFSGWSGPCTGTATTCVFTLNSTTTVSVAFTPTTVPISLVQTCSKQFTSLSSYTCTFVSAQTAGDLIACAVGYASGTVTVSGVADTKTNTYTQLATNSPKVAGGLTEAEYNAPNIAAAAAGANTVTFTLSSAATGEIRCAEYAGIATATPVDVSNAGTGTSGTALASGTALTTQTNDLLTGWAVSGNNISAADTGHGYTQRIAVSGDDMEDQQGVPVGTYNFQPTQTSSAAWIAMLVAFKGATTSPGGTNFTVNLIAGSGNGNGTVTSTTGTPNLNCTYTNGTPSGTCSTRVSQGGSITLTATAGANSTFTGYVGGGCSTSPSCIIPTVNQNTNVAANFNLSGVAAFYVNHSTGNDSNAGTQASPWKTLQHANDNATLGANGTVIHVADGTYNDITSSGTCASFGFPSVNLCITKGGSSTTVRMVWQCDNGLSNGVGSGPTAAGHCQITGATNYGVMDVTNNVDFVGFDVGNTAGMSGGIQTVTTTNTAGAQAAQGNSFHVIGNYVHDLASTASGPEGTGCPQNGAIGIGNHHGIWQADAQVINNYVARMGAFPSSTCFNTHGIYMNGTPGAVVYNNIVVGVPAVGLMLTTTCGNLVANNLLINAQTGIDLYGGDNNSGSCPNGAGLNTFDNNMVYATTTAKVVFGTVPSPAQQCTSTRFNLWANNMDDGITPEFKTGPYSCDGVIKTWNSVAPSSVFVTYNTTGTGANYALKSGSGAANAGTTQCTAGGVTPCVPGFDILGVLRPQGTAYDIGPYESF